MVEGVGETVSLRMAQAEACGTNNYFFVTLVCKIIFYVWNSLF